MQYLEESREIIKLGSNKKTNYLVCVNNEKYSEVALHFACNIAKRRDDASIILMHVIEPGDYQTIASIADKMRAEKIEEAEKLLSKLAKKVFEWSGITPVFLVKEGLIENEIISLVEQDNSINMLVLGVSPRASMKSKIVPPIVSALGNKLQIPMLIVPGNMTNRQIDEVS